MTGTNNVLTASLLKSATTEVSISSATAPTTGQVLKATSATTATWQNEGGSGEVNTASNVGTGEGVFKQKTGVDLEFKSLLGTSNKIGITNNTSDLTINVKIQQSKNKF
jgi:hypothetical protein